jgi:hypothetical protein
MGSKCIFYLLVRKPSWEAKVSFVNIDLFNNAVLRHHVSHITRTHLRMHTTYVQFQGLETHKLTSASVSSHLGAEI